MNNPDKKIKNTNEWMNREWDARAEVDVKYYIRSVHGQTENEFWESGIVNRDQILGINTSRYQKIFDKKDPKKMKVLEIGCGIGRILIPMSEVFGEAIGVDVSQRMIEIAQKSLKNIQNCKVFKTSGSDLSVLPDNSIDFCYSFIVFQHIPEKQVIINYVKEVSRVLKPGCLFRFQIFGDTHWKPETTDTWNGVHFKSDEIHKIAQDNNFEILEETGQRDQYYWITLKSIK